MTRWEPSSGASFGQSRQLTPAPTARTPNLGPHNHLSLGLGSEDQFKEGPILGFSHQVCAASWGQCNPRPLQSPPSPAQWGVTPRHLHPGLPQGCSAWAALMGNQACMRHGKVCWRVCVCVRLHSSSRPKGPGIGWGPHWQRTVAGQLGLKPRFMEGETEAQRDQGASPESDCPMVLGAGCTSPPEGEEPRPSCRLGGAPVACTLRLIQ